MERAQDNYWQRVTERPEILPSGDVTLREPREGWTYRSYAMAVEHYFFVRGTYPRTARMHPSTVRAVVPTDRVVPPEWPIYEVRRYYAPARIILSDDEPLLPE